MTAMAIVGLRLIALFLAVQALMGLTGLIVSLVDMDSHVSLWSKAQIIGYLLIPLGGSLALYFAAGPIARRLLADMPDEKPIPVSAVSLQATLFAAVGAYLLFKGLSLGVPQAVGLLTTRPPDPLTGANINWRAGQTFRLIATGLEIAFGIGLMLGARGLTRVLHEFQEFGLQHKRPDD